MQKITIIVHDLKDNKLHYFDTSILEDTARVHVFINDDATEHSVEPTRSNAGEKPTVVNQSENESPA